MHTFKTKKTTFLHNGDFSGDIQIIAPRQDTQVASSETTRVFVPFEDILDLVMYYVQSAIIEKVEDMSRHDLLILLGLALKIDSEDAPTQDHRSSR